jgi:hypothetical protein
VLADGIGALERLTAFSTTILVGRHVYTLAAMMSNVFLSIGIPLVLLPSRLLHSFSPFKVFAFDPGREKRGA